MKHVCIAALMCALVVAPAATAVAQPQPHDHVISSAAVVPAQRWLPDASLRKGMRETSAAVDELHQYELGHMSSAMVVNRATIIETAVSGMFAHCQLAPAPDAALHGILVPLLSAAQALKAQPDRMDLVAQMRATIALYPRYFNDLGWDARPATQAAHGKP